MREDGHPNSRFKSRSPHRIIEEYMMEDYTQEQVDVMNAEREGRLQVVAALENFVINYWDLYTKEEVKGFIKMVIESNKD